VLEAQEPAVVRPAVPGLVRHVLVRDGDHVERGQVLALMENREAQLRYEQVRDRLRIAELALTQAKLSSDMGVVKEAQLQRDQTYQTLLKAEKDRADLELRAPIAGVVLTPRLQDFVGRHLEPNQDFCLVAPLERLRAVVPLDQHEVFHVRAGAEAELKVFARMGLFGCRVKNDPLAHIEKDLHPALTTSLGGDVAAEQDAKGGIRPSVKTYQAELEIENSKLLLRPGMSGRVHIFGERTTWGGRIVRAISDSLSLDWRL
jgi:multidrug resistance efflux pump